MRALVLLASNRTMLKGTMKGRWQGAVQSRIPSVNNVVRHAGMRRNLLRYAVLPRFCPRYGVLPRRGLFRRWRAARVCVRKQQCVRAVESRRLCVLRKTMMRVKVPARARRTEPRGRDEMPQASVRFLFAAECFECSGRHTVPQHTDAEILKVSRSRCACPPWYGGMRRRATRHHVAVRQVPPRPRHKSTGVLHVYGSMVYVAMRSGVSLKLWRNVRRSSEEVTQCWYGGEEMLYNVFFSAPVLPFYDKNGESARQHAQRIEVKVRKAYTGYAVGSRVQALPRR